MSHLVPITEEQRELARLKRLEDQQYARDNLKTVYADEGFWRGKSSEWNMRMPNWWSKGSEIKYIRRACKKLGIDVKEFTESTGFSNLQQLAKNNPTYTAFGLVGLVVEYKTYETA